MRKCVTWASAAWLACCGASVAQAEEWSFSAYGTLGYAVSDRSYTYMRFVDDQGTFKRDSVLGAQLDLRLNPQWAATVQAKVAPSMGNDDKWGVNTAWAFVSWRPDNDWLLRLGKQRLPLYLNSESVDVGQTYDFARLPNHYYGLMPSNEFTGAYASRTWMPGTGELTWDLYGGEANLTIRNWTRDYGATFLPDVTRYVGSALTWREAQSTFRFSAHKMMIRKKNGEPMQANYPYVDAGGGLGYYRIAEALPGPPIGMADHKTIHVYTLGADVELAPRWRLVSELSRSVSPGHATTNWSTVSGYAAILHPMGRFTPYASLSRLKSLGTMARMSESLDNIQWPSNVQGADTINLYQRLAADYWGAFDERSLAVGTSFSVSPQSKLKFEWMRTEVGKRSGMVDTPATGVVRHQHIDVLSANYNFVF
jgi:hypothetical protein